MTSDHERELCSTIAEIIKDYRETEIGERRSLDVLQFLEDVNSKCEWMNSRERILFLEGLRSAFSRHYWSRKRLLNEVAKVLPTLGLDKSALVFVQADDSSQSKLIVEVDGGLVPAVETLANQSTVVYIDDATFTGKQLAIDLESLALEIRRLPRQHRALIVWHIVEYSEEIKARLESPLHLLHELKVDVKFHALLQSSRDWRSGRLDVLVPSAACRDLPRVQRFLKSKPEFHRMLNDSTIFRNVDATFEDGIFDSLESRDVVERALLEVGCFLRSVTKDWKGFHRPLGYVDDFKSSSLGFGSMFCTYLNSSNTTPMALWWGDPSLGYSTGPSQWNPLLPRRFTRK